MTGPIECTGSSSYHSISSRDSHNRCGWGLHWISLTPVRSIVSFKYFDSSYSFDWYEKAGRVLRTSPSATLLRQQSTDVESSPPDSKIPMGASLRIRRE